jgi:hypothetical protein
MRDLRAQLESLGKILNVEFTLLNDGTIHAQHADETIVYVVSPWGEVEKEGLDLAEELS